MKFLVSLLMLGALFFQTELQCAMTSSGQYKAVDSKNFMDLIITETGVLTGIRSEFLNLTVKGKADLDSCSITGNFVSSGNVVAKATNFLKNTSIYSGKTVFTSCSLSSLDIFDGGDQPIVIELRGATTVHGSITFETGNATVYKGPKVLIKGKIIGGNVIELASQ